MRNAKYGMSMEKQKELVQKNPFLIYGYAGPRYFCDREAETEKLVSALDNGRNVTLIAPRRMGKTGLIKNTFVRLSTRQIGTNTERDFRLYGSVGQAMLSCH